MTKTRRTFSIKKTSRVALVALTLGLAINGGVHLLPTNTSTSADATTQGRNLNYNFLNKAEKAGIWYLEYGTTKGFDSTKKITDKNVLKELNTRMSEIKHSNYKTPLTEEQINKLK